MVDGDALWRSDKLAQVQPPEFRAEYANLIPLALADGTFECNPRRVWADVYSYNRPDVDVRLVEKILSEFTRVGLLKCKTDENGKIWGFWNGIEARLPSESTRERYKSGKSNIFSHEDTVMSTSRQTRDNIVPRLDRISMNKIGTGEYKNISIAYRRRMGKAAGKDKNLKSQYFTLCQEHGESAVLDAFEEWAELNAWKDNKPGLYFFFKDAADLIVEKKEAAVEKPPSMTEEQIKKANEAGAEEYYKQKIAPLLEQVEEDEKSAAASRARPYEF